MKMVETDQFTKSRERVEPGVTDFDKSISFLSRSDIRHSDKDWLATYIVKNKEILT